MRRFPAVQGEKDTTSWDVRPIEDDTASGLNVSTSFKERFKIDGLCALLAAAHAVNATFESWGEDGLLVFAKGDHEKAYRQWAVSPEELNLLATLVSDDCVPPAGGCQAYAHRGLPFGATKAVWAYTGIAQGVCAILRVLFAVPLSAYTDDFLHAVPARWAALCERALQRVHAVPGIPLKAGKDKVARRIEALGHTVAAGPGWAGMALSL